MRRRLLCLFMVLLMCAGCRRQSQGGDGQAGPGQADSAGKTVVDEGCPHMVDGQCAHGHDAKREQADADASGRFGKPLGKSPEVALAEILKNPERFHESRVRVSGHVSRACSRKGCWMELAVDQSAEAPRCRVTFENYGFFVPKDSAGSHARLEGTVQVTQVKPDAVRHYESEGAKFAGKGADGSAREVRLVATGVELERI